MADDSSLRDVMFDSDATVYSYKLCQLVIVALGPHLHALGSPVVVPWAACAEPA